MFCAADERRFYDGSDSSNDDDDGENSDRDREEIESALYAQIHFHHEEEGNLSYKGYSTSVQTLGSESTQIIHDDSLNTPSTATPSGSATTSLLSPPSTNNCVVSLSSGEDSVYVVSDQDDVDLTDSECMILDEPLSDTGDILVHVESYQQPILQAAQMAASE
ncbi:uncharacterized protein LOC110444115, partial [Mizuhopecten yessoensis]|uniref:uncharacterized protein LOC110444115 n=1 Tax=Mizuhopecten yessoensis TaxID=6573 RepID=UPI000B45916A